MNKFGIAAIAAGACLFTSWHNINAKETAMSEQTEKKPLELQQLIDNAVRKGQRKLTILPGNYRVQQEIKLSGVADFAIEGYGATLVFPPETGMFSFSGCSRLNVKGITLDCDPLPFTQGTITRVSDDHNWFEYEVHSGYPQLTTPKYEKNGKSGIFVFAPDTLRWRQDIPDLYPTTSEILNPTHGKITLSGNLPGYRNINVGDFVAFKNGGGNALLFRGCDDVKLEDVTILTAPLAGFLLRSCTGPVSLRRCVIKKGPKPEGAVNERLLSTVADGFNLAYSRKGVEMEDCDFSFMGDDAVNLHGCFVKVVAVEDGAKTVWVGRLWSTEFMETVRSGDSLRILKADSYAVKAEANILACDIPKPPEGLETRIRSEWKLTPETKLHLVRFTLDKAVSAEPGDHIEIPAISCPDFVFRNNYFHDHRARGLRLGASNGLIENNRFERLKSTAISLGPHAIHSEGGWVCDVIVRKNKFSDVCFDDRSLSTGSYNAGAIVVQHFLSNRKAAYPPELTICPFNNRKLNALLLSLDIVVLPCF